jgi:hypothetical protein
MGRMKMVRPGNAGLFRVIFLFSIWWLDHAVSTDGTS